jgi:hypothetical protein
VKRHLPKQLLDWSDRFDIWMKEKHGISPKQKAIELHMDTIGNKRIDDNIRAALQHGGDTMANERKKHRKEKKKPKKPK